jgi:hypothetical protein
MRFNLIFLTAILISAILFSQTALAVLTISQPQAQKEWQPTPVLSSAIPGLLVPEQPTLQQPAQLESRQPQSLRITTTPSSHETQNNINFPYYTTSSSNMNSKGNNNNDNYNQIVPRTFLADPANLVNTKQAIIAHNNTILQSSLDEEECIFY